MSVRFGTSLTVGAVAVACIVAAAHPARSAPQRFVGFDEFQASLVGGGTAQFTASPTSRVADGAQATAMHEHLLSLYTGVAVRHSYALDEQIFDCVPLRQQPSLRTAGPVRIATPPSSAAASALPKTAPFASDTALTRQTTVGGRDGYGNLIGCPATEIPMRRVTPAEMARFATLGDFFDKGPGGAGRAGLAATVGVSHKYAHATQAVTSAGGTSYLGLWSPAINTAIGQVFSLSQQWYLNDNGSKIQTVETGWQNYPKKYNTNKSVLFIYWTADSYTKTGCYNLDCRAFVQTNNTVHLGAGFSKYSTYGGAQYSIKLSYLLSGGNWWLGVGNKTNSTTDDVLWIGYYPATLFAPGKLRTSSRLVDFGGETVGTTKWPGMGSGHFAKEGYGKAAFQRRVRYLTVKGSSWYTNEATLTAQQPSPKCYTDQIHNKTSDPNYRSYFFFGGPGGSGC